jgi:diadenosine tetraphosphate (Ap4A) HIT family hydrolase
MDTPKADDGKKTNHASVDSGRMDLHTHKGPKSMENTQDNSSTPSSDQTEGEELIDYYSDESQLLGHKSEWYDKIASSVTKCPLCDLRDKYLVAEKNGVVLTMNLFPYIDGHLMVVPRRHFEKHAAFTEEEMVAAHELTSLGMELLREELGVRDLNVLYREGTKDSGSSLKHLHIHIMPITKEFMQYKDHKFIYILQDVSVAPVEMARRLRKVCQKINPDLVKKI